MPSSHLVNNHGWRVAVTDCVADNVAHIYDERVALAYSY